MVAKWTTSGSSLAPVSLAALLLLMSCVGALPASGIGVQAVATGLQNPLYATAPEGDARLFIVEQPGRIRVLKNGVVLPAPFLDLTSKVSYGGERGLLGLAFHPAYRSNGYLYVNYTDRSGDTTIERYTVSSDPDLAQAGSAKLLLKVKQPFANHNGGMVLFGPDGRLYIGMGDGGSAGDPQGNGQNLNTLLGKLLRIDVDHGDPYAVPPDNPFVGVAGARGEIWARGMRNPWRFAFDRVTGLLYIADVGQNAWEEIDVVPAGRGGLNFGWDIMEGNHCYGGSGCNPADFVASTLEYPHAQGCSVTGGFVYRGKAIPSLAGQYFYADYCQGWVRSFVYRDGKAADDRAWPLGSIGNILSFGKDAAGELYILSENGTVYRITPT